LTAGRKGATPEEWQTFIRLGLAEDLLPIISDQSLPLSPKSTMKSFGKTPTTLNRLGQVVGIPDWPTKVATQSEVTRWMSNELHGICLNTRRIRAIDIDLDDAELAQRVVDTVELVLGELPLRTRSTSGKRLLLIDMPGEFPKRVIKVGQEKIEFLGTGQQCVVAGVHTSGVPYEWPRGLPRAIPEVSPAEFEALWAALAVTFGGGASSIEGVGARPLKARSADDADDEVVAFLESTGWVTGYGGDGKVHVRCPWESMHSEGGDPSATSWLPAGVGGIAKGNFKCMHTSHGRKSNDDFLASVGFTASEFVEIRNGEQAESGLAPIEDWPTFKRDRQDRIESTMDNAVKALSRPDLCGAQLGYDEFKDVLVIGRDGLWRPIRDTDLSALRIELERRGFKAPGAELVRAAVDLVCERNSFDSATQWARGLVWDGVPRVERFFVDHFSVRDTKYARAMGRYLWSALAGRAVCPGVKVDMVPVLISSQGTSKTSMIEALAPEPDSFLELNLEHRDDNLARSLRGKLVAEWAELRGLLTRDSEAIKAWVTRRHEEWIPKFKEFSTRFPRRMVVIGTGNKEEILDDETGERRWLPLKVGAVALEAIRAIRDQLWAEGVAMFDKHGVDWREAQELATAEHAAFKVGDEWAGVVERWLNSDAMDGPDGPKRGDAPVRVIDILTSGLGMSVKEITRREELRIGKILRAFGYSKHVKKMGKVWVRGDVTKLAAYTVVDDFV
jgi:predicted P-loop ATPase